MARVAYPQVSRSMANWVIHKCPLLLVDVTPRYSSSGKVVECVEEVESLEPRGDYFHMSLFLYSFMLRMLFYSHVLFILLYA